MVAEQPRSTAHRRAAARSGGSPHGAAPSRPSDFAAVLRDLALLVAVFVVVSVIAGLAGAANLGTALSFGTIGFAAVLVAIMLYRDRDA